MNDSARPSAILEEIGRREVGRWSAHPTVAGMVDGTLPVDVFAAWVRQDWIYLHNYVRVYARLVVLAPEPLVPELAFMAHNLASVELGLLRDLARQLGFDPHGATPEPVTAEYIAFLMGGPDDFGRVLASALPCLWGYTRLGAAVGADSLSATNPYGPWMKTYSGGALRSRVGWLLGVLDDHAPHPDVVTAVIARAFDLEWRFWDVTGQDPATSGAARS